MKILRAFLLFVALSGANAEERAAAPWKTPAVWAPWVEHRTFESAAAKTGVSFHVFKPEAYEKEPLRRFPVLYWLHGTGGGLPGVAPLSEFFGRAMSAGQIPPMLVVFPNGLAASMWCDSKDGAVPVETVVVRELVPHMDATFRTIAAREGRILEGFSMGGYGAARLGGKYPDVFGAVSVLAGGPLDLELQGPRAVANPVERERILRETFGGDLDYFREQSPRTIVERNAGALRGRVRIRVAVGGRDSTAGLNRELSGLLDRLGIAPGFTEVPGVGHNTMALLRGLGGANWEFYRSFLGGEAAAGETVHRPDRHPSR